VARDGPLDQPPAVLRGLPGAARRQAGLWTLQPASSLLACTRRRLQHVRAATGARAAGCAQVLDSSRSLDVGRHYWGLYMAGEEISRGHDRVPVQPLQPLEDLSGAGPLGSGRRPCVLGLTSVPPGWLLPSTCSCSLPAILLSPGPGGYILRYEHGKNKNNASVVGPLPHTGMQWLLRYPGKAGSAELPLQVGGQAAAAVGASLPLIHLDAAWRMHPATAKCPPVTNARRRSTT
jgi:hypothetical protein